MYISKYILLHHLVILVHTQYTIIQIFNYHITAHNKLYMYKMNETIDRYAIIDEVNKKCLVFNLILTIT